MKLHERSVLLYSQGGAPVDKEGYLQKKGELNTSYQRRWFVLKGNLLFYFERRGERDPLGLIVLEGCSVELCESEEEFAFALVYNDPGLRMYKMAAESQSCLEAWIKVLLAASYNYLKMLVGDLRQQYQDLCPTPNLAPFSCDMHDLCSVRNTLLLPDPCLSGKVGRSHSMGALSQPKPPKRSPKMWTKRPHPAPPTTAAVRLEAICKPLETAAAAEERSPNLREDFSHLHKLFGKDIVLLRRAWQEKQEHLVKPDMPDGGAQDLIDWE